MELKTPQWENRGWLQKDLLAVQKVTSTKHPCDILHSDPGFHLWPASQGAGSTQKIASSWVFPWDAPTPSHWLPDVPIWPPKSKQQSECWHQPEVPLRKAGAAHGWVTVTKNQGASAAGLSFTLKFWGSAWTPGRPWEYQLVRPRQDQRLVLKTDPDPVLSEHTRCLSVLGWDYRLLGCWPCLISHLSFLFYLGL